VRLDSLYLKKVLIIRTSSLGDVIHSLPFLSSLKKSFPSLRFYWLVKSSLSPLLRDNPHLQGIISWEKRNAWEALSKLKALAFDAAFDLQGLLRSALLPFLVRIPHRWGMANSKEKVGVFYTESFLPSSSHIVDQYLDWAESLGAERIVEFPLPREEKWERKAEDYFSSSRKKVIIIPGGGWANKRWPQAKYSKLIVSLARKGFDVFVFWGKEEWELADRIRVTSSHKANLLPCLDIPGMVSFFKRADVIVGGDTGPLHLAAALQVPVVGIYGPTDPQRNGPYGKNNKIIFNAPPCAPCWKRKCGKKDNACLKEIKVEKVCKAVEELIGRDKREKT